ncbi:DUF1415 domain-containing protein [Aestuariibacter halophilus]|uniref:DUF1415 domain-containing protein n=1 Tax=Fluctibacter halophilus TaxID=226011 RepID=A0ABS8G213_9ALTE|nr:DUF1415 domain-containing protein [Aestuariibacter halophilus]MCC2614622.1 DUF1415 domain-containing protein [Aestuariibacter halophilus]
MTGHATDQNAIEATRHWVVEVVVGLNLCPFAKREVQRDTIAYQVVHGDSQAALEALLNACQQLDNDSSIETTLLIFPTDFGDFDDYLDLLAMADHMLDYGGYRGIYQLASFHPDYCFAETSPDDPSNYTNRSPYPVLHLIREASIERVLARYPDPDSIPHNNVTLTRERGNQAMQALIDACHPNRAQ